MAKKNESVMFWVCGRKQSYSRFIDVRLFSKKPQLVSQYAHWLASFCSFQFRKYFPGIEIKDGEMRQVEITMRFVD